MDEAGRKAALARAEALLATDPAAAEAAARPVVSAVPSDPTALLILGSAFRRQGKSREAIVVLNALLRGAPRVAAAQYELGMALADAGDAQRAMLAFQAALEADSSFAEAWRALGALMFDAGQPRAAQRAYDHYHLAMVRDPKLRPAAAALYSGRADQAVALLQPLLAEDEANVTAHSLMGEALTRLGHAADGSIALERAIELNPDDDEVRLRLAWSLSQQGRGADALPHVERLLQAEPANPGYLSLRATAVGQTGDFDRSVALYEELLATHDRNPNYWSYYGHALRIVGRAGTPRRSTPALRTPISASPT